MKFNILLLFLLIFTSVGFSQRKKERVELLKREGQKFYTNRNYSGAVTCLSKALLISPSDRDLYIERAKNFYNLEQFDSTITDCNSAINLSHNCDSICLYAKSLKATSYRELNLIDSAKALYLEVLNVQPNDFYTLMSFGEYYVKLNNYDSSMYYFNKSHMVNSSSIGPPVNLVFYSNEFGYYKEAVEYGEKYSYMFQDSIWKAVNLNNIGYSKLMLDEDEEGISLINRSISLYSKNSFAFKNRALYYIKKKNIINACNDLKVAKELGGYHITKDLIEKYCTEGE